MSTEKESQGMREPSVDGASTAATWDPYEVWLDRVKKPRDEQGTSTTQTFRLDDKQSTDTARLRVLATTQTR